MYQIRRVSEHIYFEPIKVIDSLVDGTFPASYIDVSQWARFAFLIATGASDDTAVTAQVVQATAAAGTGSKNITGAALTGTSLASASGSNKFAMIEVDQEHLDIANDFDHVAITLGATGGSATTLACFFIGIEPNTKVGAPIQPDSCVEIVYVDG